MEGMAIPGTPYRDLDVNGSSIAVAPFRWSDEAPRPKERYK